ncbi:MAG: hypothetical protein JWL73_2732 [Actinomycetia bacterium]|nr:hypothetical protein [Actinomycetes bacterium]
MSTPTGRPDNLAPYDLPLDQLDDDADAEELRNRYYTLLQELRVILPGVQVLLAFLLTVPFANRFGELDTFGRALFGVAMVSALCSVISLLTPTVFHRLADRTARKERLKWGIRLTLLGVALIAVALVSGLWCVSRFIFGGTTALLIVVPLTAVILLFWIVLPLVVGRRYRR